MKPRTRKAILAGLGLVIAAAAGVFYWLTVELEPVPGSKKVFVRYEKAIPVSVALADLEKRKILRNATIAGWWARFNWRSQQVPAGTYEVSQGSALRTLLTTLAKPIRQMVRLPETNWVRRNARLLEKANVCSAEAYVRLTKQPAQFQSSVSFPLPKDSLEGYLYPDTYDLPPLLGAEGVIRRQLRNFERRVWVPLGRPKNLHRLVTVASLVELEVKLDPERKVVAGVIENRLRKGMRLQIDAAINYGIQKWRPLLRSEYKSIVSPYNLYLNDGLPPTPICSPSVVSLRAAMAPARHNYLYYVAMPDGHSEFAEDLAMHENNFRRRKREQAALLKETSR